MVVTLPVTNGAIIYRGLSPDYCGTAVTPEPAAITGSSSVRCYEWSRTLGRKPSQMVVDGGFYFARKHSGYGRPRSGSDWFLGQGEPAPGDEGRGVAEEFLSGRSFNLRCAAGYFPLSGWRDLAATKGRDFRRAVVVSPVSGPERRYCRACEFRSKCWSGKCAPWPLADPDGAPARVSDGFLREDADSAGQEHLPFSGGAVAGGFPNAWKLKTNWGFETSFDLAGGLLKVGLGGAVGPR